MEGGRVTIHGSGFPIDTPRLPDVAIGDTPARTVYASPSTISVIVPPGLDGGRTNVRVAGVPGETALLEVGTPLATGLHQVDNPVFDREGNLYVTYSGTRGQDVPVSIFRVSLNGRRESYVSGIVNPTSMTFDAAGQLYVSSRFEGSIYRVFPNGTHEPYASDLGIACGLAFDRKGVLYVGDRSGTVFAGAARQNGHGDCDAAAERRGLSCRRRAGRLRVYRGSHAGPVRSRLSSRPRHRRN